MPGTLPGTSTAQGGGLWALDDAVTLSTVTFKSDRALGGAAVSTNNWNSYEAEGGAVWVNGGTLGITNATVPVQQRRRRSRLRRYRWSPTGGPGAGGLGGGLYATGGAAVTPRRFVHQHGYVPGQSGGRRRRRQRAEHLGRQG